MTYGIKTDHLLTKTILEGVRMSLCNPLTKSLRYFLWDQLLWDHFSSFPSYEPFTVCNLLARCKQGEWREYIHSKQLSQVGGTCSCTRGLEQKDRQWAKQPHDWMWTARVFTECLSRQYLIFIHSSLCIGALTIPKYPSNIWDSGFFWAQEHGYQKAELGLGPGPDSCLKKHSWSIHCVAGWCSLGTKCEQTTQLVEYGASRQCRGDSGSGREDHGTPAGGGREKGEGRPCLSRASAAASHPVGPGKVSMALCLHPERREQGKKGRNEYIQWILLLFYFIFNILLRNNFIEKL